MDTQNDDFGNGDSFLIWPFLGTVSVLNFWGVVLMGGCEVPSFLTEAAMVLHLGRRSKCGTTSAAGTATGRGSGVGVVQTVFGSIRMSFCDAGWGEV